MGCYEIGIGRIMASLAEQRNDEFGLNWPLSVAPFKVALVLINEEDSKQKEVADYIYDTLTSNNISVIYDNRNERPGVKFKDMDLIGIPLRITVGKKAVEDIVEFKLRGNNEIEELNISNVIDKIKNMCL